MAVQRSHGSFKDFVASRTYKLRARSARSSRVQSQKLLFFYLELINYSSLCSASKEQEVELERLERALRARSL
jgi:hypothetical protein